MITFLEYLINTKFKHDLELLYGIGSKVVINSFKYSTNDKIFVIDCKLIVGDTTLEDLNELLVDGMDFIMGKCWRLTGYKQKIMIISSMDI
jgi:hypothetical protein